MKLLYVGSYTDPSGYAVAARDWICSIHDQLKFRSDIDFRVVDVAYDRNIKNRNHSAMSIISQHEFTSDIECKTWCADNDYVVLLHMTPDSIIRDPRVAPFLSARKKVAITAWEATKLPDDWARILNTYVDAVIVPCTWNEDVFKQSVQKPIYYIPHVIKCSDMTDIKTQQFTTNGSTRPFVILSVSQWIIRKGFDILLRAYLMEFAKETDVVFVLKSYRLNTSQPEQDAIKSDVIDIRKTVFVDRNVNSMAPIYFIGNMLDEKQMLSLYKSSHLFALTSRGEGFGLPYSEAIAAGVPVLCPDKGGHLDYMNIQATCLVDSQYEPCHSYGHIFTSDMDWVESSVASTRRALRKAYTIWKNDQTTYQQMRRVVGNKLKGFDMSTVGQKFIQTIDSISN